MKTRKRIIAFVFIAVTALIVADAFNNEVASNVAGAPAGRTGSPGDGGLTCAISGCHTGPTPVTQTGWITSNIPGTGYVPGTTYTITATATRPNHVKFGFEISPQNAAGTLLGTIIITSPTTTHFVGTGNKYVSHTSAGTTGTTGFHTWSFNWTAPAIGTGAVTFYGAFNVTNNNTQSTGDTIYKSTLAVSECVRPAQPSVITGNTVICPGSTHVYSVTNDVTANGYTWTLPLGWTGTSTTNSITVTAGATSGTISVVAFNNSCGNSTARTLAVSVNNVAVAFNQTNVSCFGFSNGLATANPSGGSSPYTYLWSNTSSSQTISNLSPGTYTVTVTDNIGCTKTASVTITQPVSALTGCTGSSVSVCSGDCALLNCPGSGGTPSYSYLWSPSIGLSSATIPNPQACPPATTSYTLVITDNNGCTTTSSVAITVNPLPATPVITQGHDTLFANSTGLSYQWYLNGNPVANADSNIHVTNVQGNYTVVATTIDGCSATSTSYPYFPTDISENIANGGLAIQPNPASSQITIDIPAEWKNSSLVIFNILGNVVLKNNLPDSRKSIDISSLAEGIYFATAQKDGKKIMIRFAVVK